VPAESQSSSETCMPVLLTSRAEAVCWIGDKISTSASEGRRSARRRSFSRAVRRTADSFDVGGDPGCLVFPELMSCREDTG
jgi:hypothetical protein